MRVRIHVGPHRTGTTYIQYAAFANREALAAAGLLYVNNPAQSIGIPRQLLALAPDRALAEFDRLVDEARSSVRGGDAASTLFYSSEVFFEADPKQKPAYEAAFDRFLEGLAKRGHEVDFVFVERVLEDLLTSNALLQTSLGNLRYVSVSPMAFLDYIEAYAWLKSLYFSRRAVLHLDFAHLTAGGDLFENFLKFSSGIELPSVAAIDPAIDARNSITDQQVARGLIMAPMVNWLELFGSVSRFELFNAVQPVKPPVSDALFEEVVASIPMLRDCLRATARGAIETFVKRNEPPRP
jgi:hypothetical protein